MLHRTADVVSRRRIRFAATSTLVVVVVVVVVVEIFVHGAVKATVTNAPQSQLNK